MFTIIYDDEKIEMAKKVKCKEDLEKAVESGEEVEVETKCAGGG